MATMTETLNIGWLRNPGFDLFFIFGIAAIALASGITVTINPALFLPILVADLWILGYHHVVSTYTRLTFDKASFAQHKHLVISLFPAVALAVVLAVKFLGLWVVPTVYLYWQWWHYTRQSEGISKAYAGRSRGCDVGNLRVAKLAFWAVPLTGILAVSERSPEYFLTMPLKTLPVPEGLMVLCYTLCIALVLAWTAEQVKAWKKGQLAVSYVLYVTSHFTIYFFAYIYFEKINHGWLVVNIWHNFQYILFVWMFNNRRFGGKLDPEAKFLSTISQNGRFTLYFLTCLTISTAAYFLIDSFATNFVGEHLAVTATGVGLIIYQTINFHHYIVDSRIWKLRKPQIKAQLNLEQ